MAVIGYIRVRSNKQTLEHQHIEIEQFAKKHDLNIDNWVEEKISSRKALKNRKLGELLENLQFSPGIEDKISNDGKAYISQSFADGGTGQTYQSRKP